MADDGLRAGMAARLRFSVSIFFPLPDLYVRASDECKAVFHRRLLQLHPRHLQDKPTDRLPPRFGMQYVNFSDPAVSPSPSPSPSQIRNTSHLPLPLNPSLIHRSIADKTPSQLPRYYKASFFEYVNAFKVYGSEAGEKQQHRRNKMQGVANCKKDGETEGGGMETGRGILQVRQTINNTKTSNIRNSGYSLFYISYNHSINQPFPSLFQETSNYRTKKASLLCHSEKSKQNFRFHLKQERNVPTEAGQDVSCFSQGRKENKAGIQDSRTKQKGILACVCCLFKPRRKSKAKQSRKQRKQKPGNASLACLI